MYERERERERVEGDAASDIPVSGTDEASPLGPTLLPTRSSHSPLERLGLCSRSDPTNRARRGEKKLDIVMCYGAKSYRKPSGLFVVVHVRNIYVSISTYYPHP